MALRYRRVLGKGAWVIGGQAATAVFALAGTRLITQFVSPELFGTVTLLQNLIILGRNVTGTPVIGASVRFYPDAAADDNIAGLRRSVISLLLPGLLALIVVILITGGIYCLRRRELPLLPAVLAIVLVFDVGRTLEFSLFSGERRQRPVAVFTALRSAFSVR